MPAATHRRQSITLAALIALTPAAVLAQAFDAVRLYGAAPGQDGGLVGVAFIATKAYQGSAKDRNLIVPVLDYQWRNGWFAGVSNGIGYNFSGNHDQQYGLRLTADLGRSSNRSVALRGLPDIDAKAEVGGFYNLHLSHQMFLSSSLRYGAGVDSKGAVLDLGAGYTTELMPQWRLGLGVATSVVNAAYAQSYFGITSGQAASSGYPVYSAGAGLRDARANVALTYHLAPRASITGVLSVNSLLGDAKDSPLTRKATTVNGVVAVSYAF